MALAHCILSKFLGVGCHCFPPPLDVPTFSARCLHVQRSERLQATEGGTLRGREMFGQISSRIRLPRNSRDLLHAEIYDYVHLYTAKFFIFDFVFEIHSKSFLVHTIENFLFIFTPAINSSSFVYKFL